MVYMNGNDERKTTMKFCSEIHYDAPDGRVHSDVCHACDTTDGVDLRDIHRKFYHDLLDEWLDKSNGTGAFWVGDPQYFLDWER
jgi:hypothetical protein